MDFENLKEKDALVDLESGMKSVLREQEQTSNNDFNSARKANRLLNRVRSGFESVDRWGKRIDRSSRGEVAVSLGNSSISSVESLDENGEPLLRKGCEGNKKVIANKPQKKSSGKPPKPPRPPKAIELDAGDEKLVQEISELVRLRQARRERIKALKRKKLSKVSSSSTSSNIWAMVVTILFCLIILWQAIQ